MEIFDDFCWDSHKKVITQSKHKIPGLKNFSYWNLSKASRKTPLHHHTDILELHCLIKGNRICNVNNKTYEVRGNELFLTFPSEQHDNGNYDQSPCSFYAFQIDLRNKENLLGLNKEYSLAISEILTTLNYRHLSFSPKEKQLLKLAFENISDGSPDLLRLGVQYLTCFLFKIPEFVPIRQKGKRSVDANLSSVLNFIDNNYTENILLNELAKLSGYSLSRFKIKFKEDVGMTPANYINFKKLEYCKKLLQSTNYSVTRIAIDAGFSSSNYFCTAFRKLSNYSPSEFRKLCKKI